ncbi:hypothetical protein JCM10296v2_005738 [Rhodotorula toruloides]
MQSAAEEASTSPYKLAPIFRYREKPATERPPVPPDASRVERWEPEYDDQGRFTGRQKRKKDLLSTLPLEILLAIVSHLTPGSLLVFSRTSRFFRSLTFTKRAEPIWVEARRRRGWPDLHTSGVSEVEYAKLAEGEECFICGQLQDMCCGCIGIWRKFDFRVTLIKPSGEISTTHWYLHPQTFECTPSMRTLYLVPQVLKQSAKLYDVEAEAVCEDDDPEEVAKVYITERRAFLNAVTLDAPALFANEASLRVADAAEETRLTKLRNQNFDDVGLDKWWCEACYFADKPDDDSYEPELERWQSLKGSLIEEGDDDECDEEAYLRKCSQVKDEMLAAWHGACIPAAPCDHPNDELDLMADFHDVWFSLRCCGFRSAILEYARRNRHQRLWDARLQRQEQLRPFYDELETLIRGFSGGSFVAFRAFLEIPPIKRLWLPGDAVISLESWSDGHASVLSLILERERRDKLRLWDRIVRTLLVNGHRLGDFAPFVLDREPLPFVDSDPSNGQAPYHSALSDDDMNPMSDRLASLFRCGFCSAKLTFPDIAIHVVDEHDVANVPAYALVPSSEFRKAVKGLLSDLGYSSQFKKSTFEVVYIDCRFDLTTRTAVGQLETSVGETWAQVLSGKSRAELDASRLRLSESTDRNVVKIELSPAGGFDAEENEV